MPFYTHELLHIIYYKKIDIQEIHLIPNWTLISKSVTQGMVESFLKMD